MIRRVSFFLNNTIFWMRRLYCALCQDKSFFGIESFLSSSLLPWHVLSSFWTLYSLFSVGAGDPFCCQKINKAKRRLTVDPIDFELGWDYSNESRGKSNQVEAGQLTTSRFFSNQTNLHVPYTMQCPLYNAQSSFFSLHWQNGYISDEDCKYSFTYPATIHTLHTCACVHRH